MQQKIKLTNSIAFLGGGLSERCAEERNELPAEQGEVLSQKSMQITRERDKSKKAIKAQNQKVSKYRVKVTMKKVGNINVEHEETVS